MKPTAMIVFVAIAAACGSRTVELHAVGEAGVRATATLDEAVGKSLSTRVDARVEVEPHAEGMRAVLHAGRCASPGDTLAQPFPVAARGTTGAAEILADEKTLADLEGSTCLAVHAADPSVGPIIACGDL